MFLLRWIKIKWYLWGGGYVSSVNVMHILWILNVKFYNSSLSFIIFFLFLFCTERLLHVQKGSLLKKIDDFILGKSHKITVTCKNGPL